MDVLIVGAGTMGRWFGETVDADVTFADVDGAAARAAADAVGGRAGAIGTGDENASGDGVEATFDAVCIAVPMRHVEAAIESHAPRAERAVLDVSGVMGPALEAMSTYGPDLERVSLHPLFAPDLAPGSIAVVREAGGPVSEAILADLAEAGNDLVETSATEHDEAMESVQASAHAAVLAFALAAERVPDGFETPIYAGLRDLVERMTGGTPRVYADIQHTYDGADEVAAAAERIADAAPEDVEALYREAAARWDADGRSRDRGSDGADDRAEDRNRNSDRAEDRNRGGDRTTDRRGNSDRTRPNSSDESGGDRDGRST